MDSRDRLITIVPFKVLIKPYADAEIIVSDAPVVRGRYKPHERPDSPEWLLTIKKLEEARVWPGPHDDDGSCVACAAGGGVAARICEALLSCTECLSPWHIQCTRARGAPVGPLFR